MVESRISALKAQEEQAQGEHRAALETLSFLTGTDAALLTVVDDTPVPGRGNPAAELVGAAPARPDVMALREEMAARSCGVRIAAGGFLPTLNLDVSWYVARGGSYDGSSWDAQLSLGLPLFEGGTRRSQVREQLSRLRESEESLALLTSQVETEIRKLHHAFVSSHVQVEALRDAYARAERSFLLLQKEYRLGLVNNLDVLQSMTTLLEVKRSLDRALVQVKMDGVALAIATNNFPGGNMKRTE